MTGGTARLAQLFAALQGEMASKLATAEVLSHPVAKGDQAELNWERLLADHLPRRYRVIAKAQVVDYQGDLSDEIDLLIVDRQYSPFLLQADARCIAPAESVYAAFECKPGMSRQTIGYAADKVASVRRLARTSAPIPHAGGRFEPVTPRRILGGLLTARADWAGGLGQRAKHSLSEQVVGGRLDIGCVLHAGGWSAAYDATMALTMTVSQPETAVMYFMLTLQAMLQRLGTVPAMDFGLWSGWLATRQL